MIVFELFPAEGKPSHVVDYRIDFLSSSKPVKINDTSTADANFTYDISKAKIKYVHFARAEGVLNFYLCRFARGLCSLYVFGTLISEEVKFEIKLGEHSEASFDQLHDRIGTIILKSRSMLKRYYVNNDTRSIQDHLMAYLHQFSP
jgi:hypothetical protein